MVGSDVKIPVRSELDHFGSEAVAGKRPHPLARRGIELHNAVVEEARHVHVAIGSKIESRGPIEKAFDNRADQNAVPSFELKHIVTHMTGDID